MKKQREHTMQFRINNVTSSNEEYTLFDVPETLGRNTENFAIINSLGVGNLSGIKITQTWTQTKNGRIKSISVKTGGTVVPVAFYIRNQDADILWSVTESVSIAPNSIIKFDVDVNVEEGEIYSFSLANNETINPFELMQGGVYTGGTAKVNGSVVASDLYFDIECDNDTNTNIETSGSMDYNSLVRSLSGEPIKINTISIISSTNAQLDNNLQFNNVKIQGYVKNYKVNVKQYTSPLDVSNIVKIKLKVPVTFGAEINETIKYTVNANTDVSLIFGFEFEEQIPDAEFEVIDEKNEKVFKPIKEKTETIKRTQPTINEETTIETVKDVRIQGFLISFLLTITLIKAISWIKK